MFQFFDFFDAGVILTDKAGELKDQFESSHSLGAKPKVFTYLPEEMAAALPGNS